MERAGVNVVYGFVKWKIHCKATLVVRMEKKHLRRYVHVSTGNYNAQTARLYTDLGLLTCDPEFGNDVSALFNVLTGFNSWCSGDIFTAETLASMFHKFMISPVTTRKRCSASLTGKLKSRRQSPRGGLSPNSMPWWIRALSPNYMKLHVPGCVST